jgi:predicted HD phosphohydrolase
LLHDYGHFILENPYNLIEKKKDGKHEDVGYEFLKKHFKKNVLGPIKNHVKAKRYLARDSKYYALLSKASKTSLKVQGGIMKNEEAIIFEDDVVVIKDWESKFMEIGREALEMEWQFNKDAGFTDDDDEMPDFFFNEALAPSGKKHRHTSAGVKKHLRTLINA